MDRKEINFDKVKYIVDKDNNKVAVQMDIDVFEAIEPIIEDHGLAKAIEDAKNDKTINFEDAMELLEQIDKK